MKPKAAVKHRPVFTLDQLKHLLDLAVSEKPISPIGFTIIPYLQLFIAKAEYGLTSPAYNLAAPKPPVNSLESLGGITKAMEEIAHTKEQLWEAAYNKYERDPSSCSVEMIQAAHEHMYLHDLMDAEQVAEFELGIQIKTGE